MDTLEAPKLDSFAEAKRWYETTPPIRGHKDKVRPLGRRRYHQRGSIVMPDDAAVALLYYNHKCVEWKHDNTLTVHYPKSYVTAFSVDDLCGFLPSGMWFEWIDCRLVICFREGDAIRRYLMEQSDVFQFSVTGVRSFQLHNKKREFKYSKRRGVVPKIVNERYGAFLDWATVVTGVNSRVTREETEQAEIKLKNEAGVPTMEMFTKFRVANEKFFNDMSMWQDFNNSNYLPFMKGSRTKWFHTPSCEVLDSWMTGSPEQWVHMLHIAAWRQGWFSWREKEYSLTMQQLRNFVDNIAMHLFRHEVFVEIELPDGVVPPRANRHYFRTMTIRDIPTASRIVQS